MRPGVFDWARVVCLDIALPLLQGSSCLAQAGGAQAADANLRHPTQIVTAARDRYTISGLATHLEGAKAFKHGIALFPGYPGIIRLRDENGAPGFEMRGNFLVRSRRHWLDHETLVVVVDAPSDQWGWFTQQFREVPRYGADVAALLNAIGRQYSVENWTFVGTSEGAVSAFHAARGPGGSAGAYPGPCGAPAVKAAAPSCERGWPIAAPIAPDMWLPPASIHLRRLPFKPLPDSP